MKKVLCYFSAAAAIVVLALSCAKEPKQNEVTPTGKGIVFQAESSVLQTKTTIENGTGSERIVKWAAGDKVAVWWGSEQSAVGEAAEAGTSTWFEVEAGVAENYYAVYPSSAGVAFEEGVLTAQVPALQTGAFADANIAVATAAVATRKFQFHNATAVVKFEIASADYDKAVFRGAKGEAIAGKLPVSFTESDITPGTATETATEIEIPLNGAGVYYFAVLPVQLEKGFSVSLYKGETADPAAFASASCDLQAGTLLNLEVLDGKSVSNLFVTPAGAGKKSGKSWENAMGTAELRALLSESASAAVLDGVTVEFADGTYDLSVNDGAEAGTVAPLVVDYTDYSEPVNVSFKGSDKAILSGGGITRLMTLGKNVDLTLDGLKVSDCNYTVDNGAGICVNDGAVLRVKNTVFENIDASSSKSGGAIRANAGEVYVDGAVFESTCYARNGGSVYSDGSESSLIVCRNCTFKSHTYNTGGAANNSKGRQEFYNCTFDGCYTEAGTGAAIHCNAADAVVIVDGCTFKDCTGSKNAWADKANKSTTSTGVISLQTGEVTVKGSTFENCKGCAGAVIYLQRSNACLLKCSDSVFKGNVAYSRGIIQGQGKEKNKTNGGVVAFFNNCVFYNNKVESGAWGLVSHIGETNAICFNNCTMIGNTRDQYTNQSVAMNGDGTLVFANSTYVGQDGLCSVRVANANAAALVANSIVINKGATVGSATVTDFVNGGNMKAPFNAFSSILGGSYTAPTTVFNLNDCITDATEATLTGGAYNETNNVYTWDGPAAGFTKMTPDAFETALKAVTVNNGNTVINGGIGEAFYAWLTEIGAVGKDALGTSRGAAWWPGAYQAN